MTRRTTDLPPRAATAQALANPAWPRWLAVAGLLLGTGLWFGGRTIARVAEGMLPLRMTVRSAGTFFAPFADAAPSALRTLGLVVITAVIAGTVTAVIDARVPLIAALQRHESILVWGTLGALLTGTAILYGWLAYPHHAGPTNAYIHWVDIFYGRSDRFFYVLIKPFHMLFYDMPHVLQAINGAVNVALVYAIGSRLLMSRWMALLMAASFTASGLLLTFANGAEDVMLNLSFLLLVVLLAVRRSPFLGVGLFLVHLGRPPFILFTIAFALAEVLFSVPEGERFRVRSMVRGALRNRYLITTLALTAGLFVVWHFSLWLFGVNWILANGKLFDAQSFELVARNIDGFEIHPLSMTYTLHLLWIFPTPIILGNIAAALGLRRMSRPDARLFVSIWLFVGAHLLMSEYISQLYFNVRYIAYLFPLVMITAWMVFRVPRRAQMWRPVVAGLALLLAASTLTTPTQGFELRRELNASPLAQAFYDRHELRDLVGDRPVTTDMTLSARNYFGYVLKRPIGEPGPSAEANSLVFTTTPEAYGEPEILWTGRTISLIDP